MPDCDPLSWDAVVFDLDGVLADTEPGYQAAFAATLAAFGVICPESVYARLVGVATPDRAALLEAAFPCLPVDQVLEAYGVRKAALLELGARPKHGAAGLLARLRSLNVPVGIATSASKATAERVLRGVGLRVGVVATRDDCGRGKPHPAVYLHAARLLGATPARCIAVEDTPVGAEAALAAGMRTIVVPDIVQPEVELAARCLAVVADLDEVAALLLPGPEDPAERRVMAHAGLFGA